MTVPDLGLRFTSAGYWLPCYQSSFFSQVDDRGALQRTYRLTDDASRPYVDRATIRLDANIFSRLLMVLPKKGYTSAYPLFPTWDSNEGTDSSVDPTAILFLAKEVDGASEETATRLGHVARLSAVGVTAVALVVNHDGFYVWVAAYRGRGTHERAVQNALKEHIAELVGGPFSSHHPGTLSERRTNDRIPEENLTRYRDEDLGALTFFQINTILEGLHNVNLDPRVFFRGDEGVDAEYTLGGFVRQVTAVFHPAKRPPVRRRKTPDQQSTDVHVARLQEAERERAARKTIADFFSDYVRNPGSLEGPDGSKLIHDFVDQCLYPPVRAHILDEFLTATEVISLKTMKKRIERCRRALLDELIEVTHRRDPLVQAEPPDGPVDRVDDVTEAQLRGYVMLIAAKLPLISNVLLHLQDLHYDSDLPRPHQRHVRQRTDDETTADPIVISSAVYGPYHSWRGLMRAIQSDLQSLTDAIGQARTDRMLYEQEQIHAEQESLAEIQRLNERADNSVGQGTSVTISVISNLLALLAVVLASSPLVKDGKLTITFQTILALFRTDNLPGALALVVVLVVLGSIYFLIHLVATRVGRWFIRFLRREARHEAKFYYEMDLHIDAPFQLDVLPTLIQHGTPEGPSQGGDRGFRHIASFLLATVGRVLRRRPSTAPTDYKNAARNSYRIERLEKSEALHKVYVEADIRVSNSRHMHAVLVYELLYHRPARDHDFIFKDLRVVSSHADELKTEEIAEFKRVIAERFVNPCLEGGWQLLRPSSTDPSATYDAFFTITRTPLGSPDQENHTPNSSQTLAKPPLPLAPDLEHQSLGATQPRGQASHRRGEYLPQRCRDPAAGGDGAGRAAR